MKMTDEDFENQVREMYGAWSKQYQAAFKKKKPRILEKVLLKNQVQFILYYMSHMLINGNSKQNLDRIKKFLTMQKVTNAKSKYEIHFLGGSPVEAIVHVDKINEIDIADTYGLLKFDSISIFRKDKTWTPKSAEKCYEEIKDDLAFDDYEFTPDMYGFTNNKKDSELVFLQCQID